ncbi:MAG: CBS domain-containing protein, partial [Deltaproteobacteria bacterium]|nr:CBS domain-containing protein [Deltaproteobacteria bacterium]
VLFASEIDKAPELMLKYGVRHLPIVVSDDDIKYRLVGIVSMRDLFRDLVYQLKETDEPIVPKKKAGAKIPKLGVVTLDPYLVRFLEEGLGDKAEGLFQASFEELRRATLKANAFVLDLDHVRPEDWLDVLKTFNRDRKGPFTAIVFDPALYDPKTIQILKKLRDSQNFCSFTKPLPVPVIFHKLIPFL